MAPQVVSNPINSHALLEQIYPYKMGMVQQHITVVTVTICRTLDSLKCQKKKMFGDNTIYPLNISRIFCLSCIGLWLGICNYIIKVLSSICETQSYLGLPYLQIQKREHFGRGLGGVSYFTSEFFVFDGGPLIKCNGKKRNSISNLRLTHFNLP